MPRGQRSVQREVISSAECGELIFIHKALCAAGYSPHLWTTKLGDAAYAEPALLLPLVRARDKVVAAAEAALGYELEFCVEFTGLVSWTEGAAIQWHYDSNRPHLKQRVATAVVYLNDTQEFQGGQLQFESGSLQRVDAEVGSMVAFMSDDSNVHRVTPVTKGERITLTLWFTLQPDHCEDTLVLRQFHPEPEGIVARSPPDSLFQDCGSDIRLARLSAIGLEWVPGAKPQCESSTCPSQDCLAAQQSLPHSQPDGEQTSEQQGRLLCRQSRDGSLEGCSCGGVGLLYRSLHLAMIETAWHQWQHAGNAPISCCPHKLSLKSREGVALYMQALGRKIPQAVGDWRAAGKLYNILIT